MNFREYITEALPKTDFADYDSRNALLSDLDTLITSIKDKSYSSKELQSRKLYFLVKGSARNYDYGDEYEIVIEIIVNNGNTVTLVLESTQFSMITVARVEKEIKNFKELKKEIATIKKEFKANVKEKRK